MYRPTIFFIKRVWRSDSRKWYVGVFGSDSSEGNSNCFSLTTIAQLAFLRFESSFLRGLFLTGTSSPPLLPPHVQFCTLPDSFHLRTSHARLTGATLVRQSQRPKDPIPSVRRGKGRLRWNAYRLDPLWYAQDTLPPTRPTVLTPLVRFALGTLIVLFCQCMVTLFNPVNRKMEGIRWGLVSYTVATFSFTTVIHGMCLNIGSISYIDNREFPGGEGMPPGPLGYRLSIWSGALTVTPRLMFLFNNWLADGLLVSSSFDAALTRLMPTLPLALSMLHDLLHEPLGHRLPLPRVPRLHGYVFRFSTNEDDA